LAGLAGAIRLIQLVGMAEWAKLDQLAEQLGQLIGQAKLAHQARLFDKLTKLIQLVGVARLA
jgi:hypothetical protein